MAIGNVVLPCAPRPLDIGNGQTVEVTYSPVIDREACLFEPSDDTQHRRAWGKMTVLPAQVGMKWCSDCGDWRPLSYFGDDARNRDGKRTYCRTCQNTRNRRGYANRRAG